MNAIGAIDIRVAGRAKHDRVARRLAVKTVRRRLGVVVGFELDDAAADPVDQHGRPDESGATSMDASAEKARLRRFGMGYSRKRAAAW